MKKIIYIAAIFMMCIGMVHAGDHKMGPSQACFYDSNPGHGKWHYYYCGDQARGCAGKKGQSGGDKHYMIYHGNYFNFQTGSRERYYCCGGTMSGMGKFVRADSWIVESKTEEKKLTNGTCRTVTEKDACGEEYFTDCDTPDTCESGYFLRNKACITACSGVDEVFESDTSNRCVTCETTNYQGISGSGINAFCRRCDESTEFFDRITKRCVKKSSLAMLAKTAVASCWRCPLDYVLKCTKAMNEPESKRASIADWETIQQECKIK